MGLKYRVFHWGTQADAIVMTGRAAELLALMPDKPPPDLSKFLLSPMPGLLTERRRQGRARRCAPGENLVVIEAMKMQNILKAESDCVVADVMAKTGRQPGGRSADRAVPVSTRVERLGVSPILNGVAIPGHQASDAIGQVRVRRDAIHPELRSIQELLALDRFRSMGESPGFAERQPNSGATSR